MIAHLPRGHEIANCLSRDFFFLAHSSLLPVSSLSPPPAGGSCSSTTVSDSSRRGKLRPESTFLTGTEGPVPPPASSLSLLQSQWVLCVPWLHQTSPASGFCPCRALCPILSTRLTYIPTLSLCSRVTWPWSDLSELLTSLTKSDPLLASSSSMLAPVATATLHLSPVCYFLFHPLDCKFHDGSHCFIHHVA